MDYQDLDTILLNTGLFSVGEAHSIYRACDKATLGCAIIACELLKIRLSGSDIDLLISTQATYQREYVLAG